MRRVPLLDRSLLSTLWIRAKVDKRKPLTRPKVEHAVPNTSFSCKIYLKSQADWDGILNDLHKLNWPDIYRQVDFVASMNDVFEGIIVRRIPPRVIKFRIKDKAWFNQDCKQATLAKKEAYQLWRRYCSDIT